ncbi:small nuclear ribonucleoprotein [Cryptosporidium ubiquitum]|uniref:Small nuclear ribonucleoprotein n=1 Tax=Cryptosporidium ubiquitum TaxID=857276 RepID=A0A1J4MI87_9CRYT|nr:small nuclear ribonucleoprotein [Cryptosporidium ubiquitum]OII73942.1 small nuclear ribonucleoprotein [Cryptosporidium ubiquitum]
MVSSLVTEPLDLIRLSLDEQVFVKCRGNRELKGILYAFDPHMNMVLGNVEETYYEEVSKPDIQTNENKLKKRRIEMLFLRGDLIILVKPAVKLGKHT